MTDSPRQPITDRRPSSGTGTGSAFQRVAVTAAAACLLTGSIIALGSAGVLAGPTRPASAEAAVTAPTATAPTEAPKIVYSEADLAAFASSPYADDAVNLAVVWSVDTEAAQGKAGAKLRTGQPLPFGPDEAATAPYSDEQQLAAFFLARADYEDALGLATVWGSTELFAAKARVGGLLLAHEPVPATPSAYTEEQDIAAFGLGGYSDADAVRIAALWQSDTRTAKARAGAMLLAGEILPL
ncbi:hypothetical protein ACMA46_08195 [Clavibacter sp. Sh2141]|uniref:hypothetical protein n=1 Tax=Clavibacter sp. Sh2141 TaxID=3395374 RepID=UPI0039BD25A3